MGSAAELLVIDSAAMGATPFFLHRGTTVSAAVVHTIMLEVLTKSEKLVDDEQSVAPVIGNDIGEDEIKQHAHTHENGEVGGDTYNVALFAEIVDHGDKDEEDAPHAEEESHEDGGMTEGIERGIEVVGCPLFRIEALQSAVESCGGTDDKGKERRIEARDIAEVHVETRRVAIILKGKEHKGEAQDAEEHVDTVTGELMDEAADLMVGDAAVKKC